jgi:hypothetical protein
MSVRSLRLRQGHPLRPALPLALALALTLAAGFLAPAPARAGLPQHQVWVLIHVADHGDDPADVSLRVPIEWVRESKHITTCREGEEERGLKGPEIYARYHDLPAGEEREIDSFSCDSSDVTVRVRSEEFTREFGAERIRLEVKGRHGKDVDFGISLKALESLGSFFSGDWFKDSEDREKEIEKLGADDIGRLRDLPPFTILKVKKPGETVVVATE